jgi:hypothetical protein
MSPYAKNDFEADRRKGKDRRHGDRRASDRRVNSDRRVFLRPTGKTKLKGILIATAGFLVLCALALVIHYFG